ARFPIRASNRDWEDIAIDDDGHLYIGEIGNNGGRQRQVAVYRVAEPDPNIAAPDPPGRREPLMVTATWQLRFPGDVAPFDCESLFVWKDVGYVISKRMDLGPAGLWRFSLDPQPKGWGLLEKVCDLPVNAPVGGADVSPDGKWLALVTPLGPGLLRIDTDPARAADAEPKFVSHFDLLAEGVCFTPEGVVTVAETGEITLFPTALFDSDE
ncbi:MAG: hypothetical protein ACREIT_07445, partial [Tepidisphaeraceae bacterium]